MTNFTAQAKFIGKLFFPENKQEWILISFLFIFYLSFGLILALNTDMLDYISRSGYVVSDVHFSFDNLQYFYSGRSNVISHPAVILLTKPLVFLGDFIESIFCLKAKTVFILVFTIYCVSMSCIIVRRFLVKILDLDNNITFLLCIIYASFCTCQILSFTFETFTLSLFFLTILLYYYSYNIKYKRDNSFLSNAFLASVIGGITITNFAKSLVCIFFAERNYKIGIKNIILVSLFFTCICFLSYSYYKDDVLYAYGNFSDRYITFSESTKAGFVYIKTIVDTFFIAPILSYDMYVTVLPHDQVDAVIHRFNDHFSFDEIWRYVFALIFYGLIIFSVVKNYKNRIMLMILAVFSIDIFIHLILGFGISEGFFIYGGHWIFILPLLFGFLYMSMDLKYRKILFGIFCILCSVLLINNLSMIYKLLELSLEYFPLD